MVFENLINKKCGYWQHAESKNRPPGIKYILLKKNSSTYLKHLYLIKTSLKVISKHLNTVCDRDWGLFQGYASCPRWMHEREISGVRVSCHVEPVLL